MGRRKKCEQIKRTNNVMVRFTDAEYASISISAEQAGYPVAVYVRKSALDERIEVHYNIFHRRHALHTPFCHRRFQFFKKISSGQSNRIHRIFQFFQLLAACPACYIRERVVRSINAKCRANRKCNAYYILRDHGIELKLV